MRLEVETSEEAAFAIQAIGRTEDVQFSPSNNRLAIAGFLESKVLVVDCVLPAMRGVVQLNRAMVLESSWFNNPHGLSWIDEHTLAVANRGGEVPIIRVPASTTPGKVRVTALQRIGADGVDMLHTPGSVSSRRVAPGLVELLVCNNYAHNVSRHLLAEGEAFSVLTSAPLLAKELKVPDGVAYSASGEWIAVSNHDEHAVFLYRNDRNLNPESRPTGVARGVDYPHGVRFSRGDRVLAVADAGAPYVHFFASPVADWSGGHTPISGLQVIDDEAFAHGHTNPEEGGPKGIDISRNGLVLAATCEEEPIAFFDLGDVGLPEAEVDDRTSSRGELPPDEVADRLRSALVHARSELRTAMQRADQQQQRADSLLQSSSWRLTVPFRWLKKRISGPSGN